MSPQIYQLVMRSGPTPGKTYELGPSEVTIGRDIINDIVINDAEVSRRHARLAPQAGSFLVEDMGSTNGTFVNGQRLMGPHLLRPGEVILLGENVSLAFELAEQGAGDTIVAASNVPDMPPAYPEPVEAYPQADAYPPPQPVYQQQRPPSPSPHRAPVVAPQVAQPEEEKGGIKWSYILGGCGCLLLVLCVALVGFLFWVDSGGADRWCQFFGFLIPYCQ